MSRLTSRSNLQPRKTRRPFARPKFRVIPLENRLAPATFVVNSIADTGAGTLRDQIAAANAAAGADTITFDKAVFNVAKTITLTSAEIAITGDLTIDGPTAVLTISGNSSNRIFNINGAGTIAVTLQDLTLTKGATTGVNDGGAIFVQDENLSLSRCFLVSNTSASDGGAIRLNAAGAKLTMSEGTLNSNTAVGGGGAISAVGAATITITNVTVLNNKAVGAAGLSMSAGGDLTVVGSTFRDNETSSGSGGAGFLTGTFTTARFTNSTIHSNNASVNGGGIALGAGFVGSPTFNNCTITENAAGTGDGGGIARLGGSSTVTLTSTIVFDNTAGGNGDDLFSGGTVKANVSLIETKLGVTTFSGDAFTNGNIGNPPLLGFLTNNGGPTNTRLPGVGSPAIDAGSNPEALLDDQRGTGFFRVRGKAADIGAVEIPDDFVVTNNNDAGTGSLRQAILDANTAAGNDTIVFDASFFATPRTITLTTGEMSISQNLVIDGPSANLTVSGNLAGRVFLVQNNTSTISVAVSDMTLTQGKVTGAAEGGAILVNSEQLTLTNVDVTNSSSADEGGGIRLFGSGSVLTLDGCSVVGNTATLSGGGIAASGGATVNIFSSTLSGNTAGGGGGGIIMLASGAFTLRNSTVSGNQANTGGGVQLAVGAGTNSIANCTIVNNTATGGFGGGIISAAGTLNIDSTIVSGNFGASAPDISHSGTTNFNTSAASSATGFTPVGTGNLAVGTDLKLGPLASGVHAPALNSPVLNTGSNLFALTTDQRGSGSPRQRGAGVDIGAVEVFQLLVSNINQSGAGSFAQAVADSNAFSGGDTITFDPTVFATNNVINLAGTLALNTSMEIQGPAANVTLSGQGTHRIFTMANGITYTFSNLDLLLGKGTTDGGAMSVNQAGAKLSFTNCTFGFNTTTAEGGVLGLSSASTNSVVTFTDCNISSNSTTGATQDGGAIRSDAAITLNLIRTTLSNNDATGDGGAVSLAAGSSLLVQETTFSGNDASLTGGAIALNGAPGGGGYKIINSTLSGNKSAQDGGGLSWTSSGGTLTLQNSTVTNNTASAGGGGGLSVTTGTGNLSIESTIVSGNINAGAPDIDNPNTTTVKTSAVGDNLGFVLTNAGGNLPFQPHANLKLSGLGNNGGPTNTHVPQTGSPLIGVGSNPAALATEQRGAPRAISGTVDIGSTEFFDAIVRNTNDSGTDSLRDVIGIANAIIGGGTTVTFDPAVFATAKTITLTSGQLLISDNLTISAPAVGVTISGNNASRVMQVGGAAGLTVSLSNLTFQAGKTTNGGGLAISDDTVTLTDCRIIGNGATGLGGGIAVTTVGGSLTLVRCTVANNSTSDDGGGIAMGAGNTTLVVDACTISGNNAGGNGGGIERFGSGGSVTVRNSTISGNGADNGGGLFFEFSAPLTLQNSTVVNNIAIIGSGGGLHRPAGGTSTIESSIVFGNTAVTGPQIFSTGTVNVSSSFIGSSAGATITGDKFTTDNLGVDPQLGPLQNNGGPTLTHQPAFNSPVVNNGTNPAALTTDQRGAGFARDFGFGIDVGAVEAAVLVVTNVNNAGFGSLRQAVLDANATAGADTIIFDKTAFATSKTISLTSGEMTIVRALDIIGPAAGVNVSGNNSSRVFNISGSGTFPVSISDLDMVSGIATGSLEGGALFISDESVTLTRCAISQNVASAGGGGIHLEALGASLTLIDCLISANIDGSDGGGIDADAAATIVIQDCDFFANQANFGGGLALAGGSLTITGSTFFSNSGSSGIGGGLALFGPFTSAVVRNSTLTGNKAGDGGGIGLGNTFSGTLLVQNSTVTQNSSTSGLAGGGISRNGGTGTITLASTIVSGNTAPTNADIFSPGLVNANFCAIGVSKGFTLSGSSGNNLPFQPHANLKLGAFAGNGGPTGTHQPAFDSPLADVGSNPAGLTFDQRGAGFLRSNGPGVDIGAVESRTFYVQNTNNSGSGSLRQAILDANALPGDDLIRFDPAVFATAKTITLTIGQLTISESVTVSGSTAGVTISGNNASRILQIIGSAGSVVTLDGLTLTAAKSAGDSGGAVRADKGTLKILNCTVTGNVALAVGGVVQYAGSLEVRNSSFTNNTALTGGAGGLSLVAAAVPGTLLVENCLIANNIASFGGGMTILGDDITSAVVRNSTFTGNTSQFVGGGAISSDLTVPLVVQNCTIVGNKAGGGGGLRVEGSGALALESSIVFGNTGGGSPDLLVTGTATVSTSLIGSKTGVTTFTADKFTSDNLGQDPLLGPLQNNGGPTLTMLPANTSKAVNNGSNPAALSFDQRGAGFLRSIGVTDIGAVETRNLIVTTSADTGAGSLRDIIADANALVGPDTITFDPAVFGTAKTITLLTALPNITDAVTITGTSPNLLTVRRDAGAASKFRVVTLFSVSGAASTLSGMTISGGDTTGRGGGVYVGSNDSLTLNGVVISGNKSTSDGGGLAGATSTGLTLFNCTVTGNSAGADGGGIYQNVGTLIIDNSTIANNTATNDGGGIAIASLNGVHVRRVRNSTISGNAAGSKGGGLAASSSSLATLAVHNSTLTANSAGTGGGVAGLTPAVNFNIQSSIVAGNAAGIGPDISSSGKVEVGTCLIGQSAGFTLTSLGGNLPFGTDPLLGPLADNGGPTLTHRPANASPVLDKGSNPAGLTTDQRGFARVRGAAPEIGAVELPIPLVVLNANDSGPGSLRQLVIEANTEPGQDTITFDPTFFASAKTITLTSGQISITAGGVSVTGPVAGVTIDGNKNGRIFEVSGDSSDTVTFDRLTLTGGKGSSGGAILAKTAQLRVLDCVVTGNEASGVGGLSMYFGGLEVRNSTISGNKASGGAGGLTLVNGTSLLIENCTVSGNSAAFGGGMTILGSFSGPAVIRNTTFSGNTATTEGGGLFINSTSGTLIIQNATFTGNAADDGGGLASSAAAGVVSIESCIVSGNAATGTGPDIQSSKAVNVQTSAVGVTSGFVANDLGGNLLGVPHANLKLGPLANNGGPTKTHALLVGSVAINAGSNPAGLTTDQRGSGFVRVVGAAADMGAFEFVPPPTAAVQVNNGVNQRSRVTTLKITFDQIVTLPGSPETAFKLARQGDNAIVNLAAAVDNSGPGTVVTLTFTGGAVNFGSLADGRYTLTAFAALVSPGLDGNGDGAAGDDLVLVGDPSAAPRLFRLFGDADGDGDVDAADFGAFRGAFGVTTNLAFDFDGDGDVDAQDFGQFRQRFGTAV